jgi:hypothetical protein
VPATFLRIVSAEGRVFQGSTPNVAKNVMAGACKAAGVGHFYLHDLPIITRA